MSNEYTLKEFIETVLLNPGDPRVAIILESRCKDVTGFGENRRTLRETGKIMGTGHVRPRQLAAKYRRTISAQLNRIMMKSKEKFIIKEVERIEREKQLVPAMHINALELSVRAENCLKNENIRTVEQLIELHDSELLLVPNFGRKSLAEIKERLSELGLKMIDDRREA